MSACHDKNTGQHGQDRSVKKMDYEKNIKRIHSVQIVLIIAIIIISIILSIVLIIIISPYYLQIINFILNHIISSLLIPIALMLASVFLLQKCKKNLEKESKKKQKNKINYNLNKLKNLIPKTELSEINDGRSEENEGTKTDEKEKLFLWIEVANRLIVSESDKKGKDFFIHLGRIYFQAKQKKEYNKAQYFAFKKKAARYQNIKSFLQGLYNQKTIIAGVAGYVGTGALSVYASVFKEWIVWAGISVVIILIIALAGYIFLRSGYYDSEIELRKFGETWVRHEATVTNLENVMMQYVMELDEFSKDDIRENEKKLFMEKVGKVLMDNEEKFQKNMEKIE